MLKSFSRFLIATASAVVITTQVISTAMTQTLPEAVSAPLNFVERIKENPDWIAGQIKNKAIGSDWTIENGNLVTNDVAVLQYVNKIRAFLSLDDSMDELPFFVLPLVDEKGATGICVTRFPRDILPKLGARDFVEDQYRVADLNAPDVRACLVKGPSSQPFETMDRATFLSTYFLEFGLLDTEKHGALRQDPDFIKRAFDLGFFPYQGALSGYLQVN